MQWINSTVPAGVWKSFYFPFVFPTKVIGALAQKTKNMGNGIGWDLDMDAINNSGFSIHYYDGAAPFTVLCFGF